MEEEYLQEFDCFNNSSDSYIYINDKTPLYYIKTINNKTYIAWRNLECITTLNENNKIYVEYIKNYYNVIDGSLLVQIIDITDLDGNKVDNIEVEPFKSGNVIIDGYVVNKNYDNSTINSNNIKFMLPLYKILNLEGNKYSILNVDDIKDLTDYNESDTDKTIKYKLF